ncbi:hypothetical protein [Paenibacillus xylanexedens]|uniref:Uncharacterized protein n=1 Tax=Paenibacillus xylanexedens TaxID=528191 RepID=A0ABS4RQZ5_PAEXY|nr:hypothetical protein [Paenibacillus xylanexedens]MBP2245298.1 hypothetical protein [Paenibacillus xylanexedens]
MKLIDADKLLYDLANEDISPDVHAFVLDKIERGQYDPTIKPGDTVTVIEEIHHPFLQKVKIESIQWYEFGWYANVVFDEELFAIPLKRCQKVWESIPKEDTKR